MHLTSKTVPESRSASWLTTSHPSLRQPQGGIQKKSYSHNGTQRPRIFSISPSRLLSLITFPLYWYSLCPFFGSLSLAAALILTAVVAAQNESVTLNVDAIEDEPHISSYDVDLHDCPSTCVDYSNPHSWIPYLNANHLRRCREPLL